MRAGWRTSDTAITMTNPREPSSAALDYADSLIAGVLQGDQKSISAVLSIQQEIFSNPKHRQVAAAVHLLDESGRAIEILSISEATGIPVIKLGDLATPYHPIDPAGAAEYLASEYEERRIQHKLLNLGTKLTAGAGLDELEASYDDLVTKVPSSRQPVDLATRVNQPIPDIEFLLEGTVPTDCLVLLTGRGGLGKSGVTLTLLTSLACGRPLLPSFTPAHKARTLWLCSEDDENEVLRRFSRIRATYSLTDRDVADFAANVRLYAVPGFPLVDLEARTTAEYGWLRREVRTFKPDLIVLDPLAHYNGTDENSNTLMSLFFSRIRDLCSVCHSTIIVVHHTSKEREGDAASASARGASAIRDAARCILAMVPLTEKEVKDCGISNPKLFSKLEHVKASWTALLPNPVYLRNTDGVWSETDLAAEKAELASGRLAKLAGRVAEYLGNNESNLTVRDIVKGVRGGRDIRNALTDEFGQVTRTDAEEMLEYGEKSGIIYIDRVSGNGQVGQVPRRRGGVNNEY